MRNPIRVLANAFQVCQSLVRVVHGYERILNPTAFQPACHQDGIANVVFDKQYGSQSCVAHFRCDAVREARDGCLNAQPRFRKNALQTSGAFLLLNSDSGGSHVDRLRPSVLAACQTRLCHPLLEIRHS